MAEQIIDGTGSGYPLRVNIEGALLSDVANAALTLIYSGTVIGSIIRFPINTTGSFVRVLTYTGNNLTGVGSWV
jgi:hypothetical protein